MLSPCIQGQWRTWEDQEKGGIRFCTGWYCNGVGAGLVCRSWPSSRSSIEYQVHHQQLRMCTMRWIIWWCGPNDQNGYSATVITASLAIKCNNHPSSLADIFLTHLKATQPIFNDLIDWCIIANPADLQVTERLTGSTGTEIILYL